jgi:lysophospholipase L1-like esterase
MKKIIFFISLLLIIIFLPIYTIKIFFEPNLLNFIIAFFISLFAFEIIFIFLKKKYPLNTILNIKKNSSYYYDTHPYLPYTLKPNAKTSDIQPTNYILQKKEYFFPKLIINKLGFLNGKNGNKPVKKNLKNKFSIGCVGNSTTLNYINDGKKNYSYPIILENILRKKFKNKNIEVNNFGAGLYNSTEILIRFIIQILDLAPSMIILYCGHNDYEAYLTDNFKKDYSHYRQNLSKNYWRIQIYKVLPKFRTNVLSCIYQNLLGINLRHTLNKLISKGKINLRNNYKGKLVVFERNIQAIVTLCKSKNIQIILSSYCYYLHPKIKKNLHFKKIEKIIEHENKIIKKIAKNNNITFVDNAKLIKKNNTNFLDDQHFSPEGMQVLAENFSKKIKL